ncbi:hypothetical protein PQC13_gp178 [Synechococcus phage S-SRM01]|uniref:Uncharacterized protein n=1 Tax=Synechococcus phage S-SRM01 TaxID=2781608 RepID=A0A879R1S3_9CAUD|nr:hypothetical protein PQC13_gp178 [Synechococcus phage S-SRM01]QPX48143.1 hypothetical protein [Synechococcus phage S-SRM01]
MAQGRWIWSVLVGHDSPNGAPLTPPTPHRSMTTIQVVINGNQVQGQIDEIAKILSIFNDTLAPAIAPVVSTEPAELAPFNAFLTVELTPYFGAKGATTIVNKLKLCRECGDFRYLIPVYRLAVGDLQKRQLLKVVSAVYRYKFGGHKNPEQYSLRSEIKYAKACDHCGSLAQVLVNRLTAEGLWK